jgi:hypothetical protein
MAEVSGEEKRLNLETWFRGVSLLLVVAAIVIYPLYALIFRITGTTLSDIVAPVTGIAGAIVGYWFGQASRRIPNSPNVASAPAGDGPGAVGTNPNTSPPDPAPQTG